MKTGTVVTFSNKSWVFCGADGLLTAELTKGAYGLTVKALGVHKTTLFRKIRTLKIDLPEHAGRRHAAQQGSD